MTEVILSAHFITDEIVEEAERIYRPKLLKTDPQAVKSLGIGDVIITQVVHVPDPMYSNYKWTYEENWRISLDDLHKIFNIVDDENRSETFAIIVNK